MKNYKILSTKVENLILKDKQAKMLPNFITPTKRLELKYKRYFE